MLCTSSSASGALQSKAKLASVIHYLIGCNKLRAPGQWVPCWQCYECLCGLEGLCAKLCGS